MRRLLSALCLTLLIQACASGNYDSDREWRLRKCEAILDAQDRRNCLNHTPHYQDR